MFMKRIVFFLFLSFSFSYSVIVEEDTVTVITSDDNKFTIARELAVQCKTIKHALLFEERETANSAKDAACAASSVDDESGTQIPLLNIDPDLMPTLTTALRYSVQMQKPDARIEDRAEALVNFAQLVDTPILLYKLTMAANYLEASHLLNLCLFEWSAREYSPTSTILFPELNKEYSPTSSQLPATLPTVLPCELDVGIAQRMGFSHQLTDSTAKWVADTLTSATLLADTLEPDCSSVWSCKLSPNKKLLATGHAASGGVSHIALFDLTTTDDEITYIPTTHGSAVSMVHFNQTDTVQLEVWSAGEDGTVQVWDAADGNHLRTYQSPFSRAFVFRHIPEHNILVTDGNDGQGICVFDLSRDSAPTTTLEGHEDDDHQVLAIESAHDNSQFVSGSADGSACIWDAATRRLLKKYDHDSGVMAISLSTDIIRLACGLANGTVVLRDIKTDRELFSAREHTNGIWSVLFARQDSLLCSGGVDNLIVLWDLCTRMPIMRLDGHKNSIHYLTINEATQRLYSASHDDTMKVWDLSRLTQPVERLHREFSSDLTIDQVLMLKQANKAAEPFRVDTPPQRRHLFESLSDDAKQLLQRNLGIVAPERDE